MHSAKFQFVLKIRAGNIMKSLIILLVVTSLIAAQRLPQNVPLVVSNQQIRTGSIIPPYVEQVCTANKLTACRSCNEISVCSRETYLPKVKCPLSQPHCVKGVLDAGGYCSATPDPTEAGCDIKRKFICNAKGYFPDPFDCQKAYYCRAANDAQPINEECPNPYVNDLVKEDCQLRTPGNCITVPCNATGLFMKLGTSQFFGHCVDEKPRIEFHMFKCDIGTQFNGQTCVFVCPQQNGNFPVAGKPRQFYRCLGGQYTIRECRESNEVFQAGKCIVPTS